MSESISSFSASFTDLAILAARFGPNATALQEVLEKQVAVRTLEPTVAAVSEAIEIEAALVVLTEEVLTDTALARQLGQRLNQQPDWSDIPVIILLTECQRFGDCLTLLGQTTHQRSVLLLELPLKRPIFASVVSNCLENRRRQYKLRDTLHQLTESNQALENFSYTAAHELRNPLGLVITSLGMVAGTTLTTKQQKLVDMGLRTAERMNKTLQTLLDYSKITARSRSEFEFVDMNKIARRAKLEMQVVIESRQAEVVVKSLPIVWGKEPLLIRLLSNLINNAIVHKSEGVPIVEIGAEESSNRWIIHVRDNGPGIADENQEKVFQLFNRAGKSRAEGSGIGLALCRRVVEQHGGTIGVNSKLGEGSDFYFDLPKEGEP